MEMYEARKETCRVSGKKLCKALEEKGYKAFFAENCAEVCEIVKKLIPADASVGIPGSVTIREAGLCEMFAEQGNRIYTHWDSSLRPEERTQRLIDELTSDWFVMSTNAITENGVMVNMDGVGNRVGAMSWAAGKLLVVAGCNKIVPDLDAAIKRVRNTAAPANGVRLGIKAPSEENGYQFDKKDIDSLCRITTILERAPMGRDCYVIIAGEELGY